MVYQESHRNRQQVCVAVEVDLGDPANFLFAYIHELDSTGIFVRTTSPEAPGTALEVRIVLCDHDRDILFELDGEVAWVNPYRPDDNDNLSPGMAVRLFDVTREQRAQLIALSKCITYIVDESRLVEPAESVAAPLRLESEAP